MLLIQLMRLFRKVRARKALGFLAVAGLLLLAIGGNTICFYAFDSSRQPELTLGDALWYSVISVTTIGYGDFSAQSVGARIGTAIFIVMLGLTAFSLFFGLLVDWVTEVALKGDRGMGKAHAKGHTVIVHFPAASRVEQLIAEIRSEQQVGDGQIVIIDDTIEHLPFDATDVVFIRGSSLSEDTYRRAAVDKAARVIVLATAYDAPSSDAVVASAVSVIDNLNPNAHIVAECLEDSHRQLFRTVRSDAVISAMRITGNLLVQESQDPGISQVFDIITSNLQGDTLYSTRVENDLPTTYTDLAGALLGQNVNILSIVRGDETFTNFAKVNPVRGDRIVYLSERRRTWEECVGLYRQARGGEGGGDGDRSD